MASMATTAVADCRTLRCIGSTPSSQCRATAVASLPARRIASHALRSLASVTHIASWQRCDLRQATHSRVGRAGAVRAAADEEVEEELMMIEESAMERMEKTLDSVRGNFNTVRTGRASPSLLDRIEVEYYGTNVILKSIAQIATPDASMLLVTPFDKSSIPSIEKAIMKSDVGLTPSSDGNVIRLSIPQLTAERRKELLKTVSKLSEDGKVALRNVRRDSIKAYEKLQKDKKISEDALKDLSNDIQKMTDDYVKQIETAFKQKEKDLLTV
ncbi:unnamed protein product [Closterium sp. NIES-53]